MNSLIKSKKEWVSVWVTRWEGFQVDCVTTKGPFLIEKKVNKKSKLRKQKVIQTKLVFHSEWKRRCCISLSMEWASERTTERDTRSMNISYRVGSLCFRRNGWPILRCERNAQSVYTNANSIVNYSSSFNNTHILWWLVRVDESSAIWFFSFVRFFFLFRIVFVFFNWSSLLLLLLPSTLLMCL